MGTFDIGVIQSNTNEKDFFKLIYNWLMGLDDNITFAIRDDEETLISTDPDDITFTYNTPINLDFSFNENVKFRLQSKPSETNDHLNAASCSYNIGFYLGNNTIASESLGSITYDYDNVRSLAFHAATKSWGSPTCLCDSIIQRSIKCAKYIDNTTGILIVYLGNYTVTDYKNCGVCFMRFKDTNNNYKWAAKIDSTGKSIIEQYDFYNSDGSSPINKKSMFSYEARTGYLDFISHSSFVSGTTKVASSTDIYDCTTVNFGDTLSLKDGANFLAIGSHSMVPLS